MRPLQPHAMVLTVKYASRPNKQKEALKLVLGMHLWWLDFQAPLPMNRKVKKPSALVNDKTQNARADENLCVEVVLRPHDAVCLQCQQRGQREL